MKIIVAASVVATVLFGATAAAGPSASTKSVDAGALIGTGNILDHPTALINKNNAVFGNNVFVARSKVLFTQNDRFALIKSVEAAVKGEAASTAVLTKNVLRAISMPSTDATVMTKASAVVAAKDADPTTLAHKIADFVDTAAKHEMDLEASHMEDIPRGVRVLIGSSKILNQPSGVVNKNFAMTGTQVSLAHSAITPTQNDQVTMSGDTKVADAILPNAYIKVGSVTTTSTEIEHKDKQEAYRTAFLYRQTEGKDAAKEFFGYGLGYRYPMSWWGLYGGGSCGLGVAAGPYFYC